MKRLILLLWLTLPVVSFAQEEEIREAQEKLNAGDRKGAVQLLKLAQQSIIGGIVESMKAALPEKVGDYVLQEDQGEHRYSVLRLNKRYQRTVAPSNSGDKQGANEDLQGGGMVRMSGMNIYMTDNLSEAGNVFMLHSFTEEQGAEGAKPVMVEGFKAILNDSDNWKSLEIATNSVFIRINGEGVDDIQVLLDLAKAIDHNKLDAALGN